METAFDFELRKHSTLSILGHRAVLEKSLGQMRLVVTFKYILVPDISEDRDCFIKYVVDFLIRFLRGKHI